jgi:hypothetical protein
MDLPVEVDSRGKGTENDPRYYVITDRMGRVICDTLNCDHLFTPYEQKAAMEDIARGFNQYIARQAGN